MPGLVYLLGYKMPHEHHCTATRLKYNIYLHALQKSF